MGSWVSKLGGSSNTMTLQEELVVPHFCVKLDKELENSLGGREAYVSENMTEPGVATKPILHYPTNATGELFDGGGPQFEQRNGQRLEMSNYSAAGSVSPSAPEKMRLLLLYGDLSPIIKSCTPKECLELDIGEQQWYEQPRNISRHSPLSSEDESREEELKSVKKFAYWSGTICFTGVMGIIAARVGNLTLKKLPLYACAASTCAAFIISILLVMFTTIFSPPKNSTIILKGTQCLILGLVVLSVGLGFAMVF